VTALSPTARGYTSYANFLSGFSGLLSTSNRITRAESLALTNATLGATLRRARTTVWPTGGVSTTIVIATNDVSADGRRSWQRTWDGTRAVTNYSGRGLPDGSWVVLSTNLAPDGSHVVSQSQYGQLTSVTRRASKRRGHPLAGKIATASSVTVRQSRCASPATARLWPESNEGR